MPADSSLHPLAKNTCCTTAFDILLAIEAMLQKYDLIISCRCVSCCKSATPKVFVPKRLNQPTQLIFYVRQVEKQCFLSGLIHRTFMHIKIKVSWLYSCICNTIDRETFAVKIISRWWPDHEIKTHENFLSTKL